MHTCDMYSSIALQPYFLLSVNLELTGLARLVGQQELGDFPVSASPMLGLQECVTRPGFSHECQRSKVLRILQQALYPLIYLPASAFRLLSCALFPHQNASSSSLPCARAPLERGREPGGTPPVPSLIGAATLAAAGFPNTWGP